MILQRLGRAVSGPHLEGNSPTLIEALNGHVLKPSTFGKVLLNLIEFYRTLNIRRLSDWCCLRGPAGAFRPGCSRFFRAPHFRGPDDGITPGLWRHYCTRRARQRAPHFLDYAINLIALGVGELT